MKTYLRLLLRRLGRKLRRLVRRDRPAAGPPANPKDFSADGERLRRRPRRYLPVWVGSQILALPLIEDQRPDPVRDFYEDT
ncbi:MAG: hypothetical protein JSS11_09470 [Verrucomicrobia bacterium]|nr:hypothetical protein [Verrucomicrobiota bacterium]